MPFGNIQELKRAYSANFDSLLALFEKTLEDKTEFQDNSIQLKKNLLAITSEIEIFQAIFEKNPELKIANLINANMTAKEIFEVEKETGANHGVSVKIIKLIEKINTEQVKLTEEQNSKAKKDLEINYTQLLKNLESEKTSLRGKIADFLKFLETSGNLEIKNQ